MIYFSDLFLCFFTFFLKLQVLIVVVMKFMTAKLYCNNWWIIKS